MDTKPFDEVNVSRFEPYSYRNAREVPPFPDDKPLIVFDGICNLCSGWANFVLRHDKQSRFRLLTAQSELGRALYLHYGLDPDNYETNVLIEDGNAWFKSEACIRMATGLGAPWSLAIVFRVLPLKVRDWLYVRLAANRYRWFGKRNTCYLPTASNRGRFLS